MTQMSNRRELTSVQRTAKKERDRRRRREHAMEFERLKGVEVEYKRLSVDYEKLNELLSNSNILHQQRGQNLGLHEHHLGLEKSMNLAESWLLDKSPSPSPNEELANNEHITHCPGSSQSDIQYAEELANNEHITHCPGSSQSDVQYADELVEDFIKKLDAKEKSKVDFSDFDGLMEEMEISGRNILPPSLASFETTIKEKFGEIDADSTQSSCAALPSRILFCAAIREINDFQLERIDEEKILLWRDAFNSALNINFKVEFAIMHLKKIAHAYFGLKAWNELLNDPELMSITKRISELQATYAQKVEARNSEMKKKCVHDAEYFVGKSLSAGLFQWPPSSLMI